MAAHVIPDNGVKHLPSRDCPCRPRAAKRRHNGVIRTVYTHATTDGSSGHDQRD